MAIVTRRYQIEDLEAVERLNQRLEDGGSDDRVYPEDFEDSEWDGVHGPLSSDLWVAAGENEVRGGVWLKEHNFWADGGLIRAGWIKYPVAESVVDRKFGGVPTALIFRLIRQQPRLLAIGMGGSDGPLARLLKGMGWHIHELPLYIHITRPAHVFRKLAFLRSNPIKRCISDILAFSGLGWAAVQIAKLAARANASKVPSNYHATKVDRFEPWVDQVWERSRDSYAFCIDRSIEMLDIAYPQKYPFVIKLRIKRNGDDAGWACVTLMDYHKTPDPRFGRSKVGMILDYFGLPEDAGPILNAAKNYLRQLNVDLIVANVTPGPWEMSLKSLGFIKRPSNFAFAFSPDLAKRLGESAKRIELFHITYADGHFPEAFAEMSADSDN